MPRKKLPDFISIHGQKFRVDCTHGSDYIQKKYNDSVLYRNRLKGDQFFVGMMVPGEQTVYICKDLSYGEKVRVLVHETAEIFDTVGELELDVHTKVVSLENLLVNFILSNPKMIDLIREVHGKVKNAAKDKNLPRSPAV